MSFSARYESSDMTVAFYSRNGVYILIISTDAVTSVFYGTFGLYRESLGCESAAVMST